ncbi:MAG: DUF4007 family protein [Actinomycetota bacterium]|nr:DUF4007 family protein [Actinomycetota bacterium]
MDYLARVAPGERSISIARLTSDPGSPGRAFRLTESALFSAISAGTAQHPRLRLVEPGGLRQLVVNGDAHEHAAALLQQHYEGTRA